MDLRSHLRGNRFTQLIGLLFETRTADPSSPALGASDEGYHWWRSDLKQVRVYDGAAVRVLRDSGTPITSADIQDGTIVGADVANSLKANDGSGGTAADAAQALRALGQTFGTAMPGVANLASIASGTPTNGDVALNNHKLTGVADPTAAQDAATKNYVDSTVQGLDEKASVKVATTGAASLGAATFSGTGTWTANVNNSSLTVDGVTLALGDRILVKDDATPARNGLYTMTQQQSAGSPWILTRSTDADIGAEVTPGLYTYVEQGTVNAASGWVLTTTGAIVLGTTGLTFVQFSGAGQITAGGGLTKTGNTLDVRANADGTIIVNADDIQVGNVPVSKGGTGGTTAATARANLGAPGKYAASIGDGASTSLVISGATHGLGNGDLTVHLYDITTPTASVRIEADVTVNRTTFDVTIAFTNAPATNSVRAVIVG